MMTCSVRAYFDDAVTFVSGLSYFFYAAVLMLHVVCTPFISGSLFASVSVMASC